MPENSCHVTQHPPFPNKDEAVVWKETLQNWHLENTK